MITSLRLSELKLTEGSNEEKLTHGYDKDDLVTSLRRTGASNANSLMLTRSATGGFLMAADIGTPNILREEVTYDGWGAPTEIRGKWGGAGMGQIGLTYDATGRVVQKIEGYAFPVLEPPPAMSNMSNETWSYTYDAAGRLESATEIPSAPRVYTYDARGNRNVAVVDEQDRATQVGAPGQPDYTFYTYDAHGNVATRIVGGTTHTYTWDGEGSLLGVAGTTPGTITYDVDAKGRRVGKRVNGALERQWMYDGQLRIVAEVVYASPVRYRVYGYVPERHLPVLMLEEVSGVESQYRIYGDHLGSLRAVVRVSDGKAIQTMRHGPWGEVEDDSVASTFSRVPFGFAGGIYDEVTGLVRFGAREYDARTGRWLSKDEARFGGGENFFEYAAGAPTFYVDPTGRGPLDFFRCLMGGTPFSECWDDEYDRISDNSYGPANLPPPPDNSQDLEVRHCVKTTMHATPARVACCSAACGIKDNMCPTPEGTKCVVECSTARFGQGAGGPMR